MLWCNLTRGCVAPVGRCPEVSSPASHCCVAGLHESFQRSRFCARHHCHPVFDRNIKLHTDTYKWPNILKRLNSKVLRHAIYVTETDPAPLSLIAITVPSRSTGAVYPIPALTPVPSTTTAILQQLHHFTLINGIDALKFIFKEMLCYTWMGDWSMDF